MNLHFAAWTGNKEIVEMLVREGEDVTMQDSYGWTALHLAVWNMHTDIVIFLLEVAARIPWVSTQSQNGSLGLTFGDMQQRCRGDSDTIECRCRNFSEGP